MTQFGRIRLLQGFRDLTEKENTRVREFNDATDAAGLPLEAAAMDLFNTAPTTPAGIVAALRYIRIQHGDDGKHVIQGWHEDEDGEHFELAQFAEKYSVNIEWLITGKGRIARTPPSRSRHEAPEPIGQKEKLLSGWPLTQDGLGGNCQRGRWLRSAPIW